MDLKRTKKITDKNFETLCKDHLYRGHQINDFTIEIQCMNKDIIITFDFQQEWAKIECCGGRYMNGYVKAWSKFVNIETMAPRRMFKELLSYC